MNPIITKIKASLLTKSTGATYKPNVTNGGLLSITNIQVRNTTKHIYQNSYFQNSHVNVLFETSYVLDIYN